MHADLTNPSQRNVPIANGKSVLIPIVAILSTVFIGFALLQTSAYPISNVLIVTSITVLIWGVLLATRGNRVGFAHPVMVFFIGFLQYYVFGPLTQVLIGSNLYLATKVFGQISPRQDSLLAFTIFVSLLGLLAFFAGYFSGAWKSVSKWKVLFLGHYWKERPAKLVAIGSTLLFVASLWAFFSVISFSTYSATPRGLRHFLYAQAPGFGFLIDASATAVVLICVLLMERYGASTKSLVLMALCLTPYTLFHQAFFSGSRINFVRVVGILLVYWHLRIKPVKFTRLFVFASVLIILVVVFGFARNGLGREDFDLVTNAETAMDSPGAALTVIIYSFDFPTTYDIFMMMTNHIPDFTPGYGITYAKLLLSVIPRTFWPDKPDNVTWVATQIFRPEMVDLGVSYNPSILGEMYYNLGILGVVAGSFLFGVTCRLLYHYVNLNRSYPAAILIYSALLFSVLEQFRGAFSNITTYYLVFYVVPVLVISAASQPKRRRSAHA